MKATTRGKAGDTFPVFKYGVLPQFPLPASYPCATIVEVLVLDWEWGSAVFQASDGPRFCLIDDLLLGGRDEVPEEGQPKPAR